MIQSLLLVALGGAAGSVARFLVMLGAGRVAGGWPWGTLLTGVLGGFTTFSAFSLDALTLWERGDPMLATLYVGASVLMSLAALAAGLFLARSLT